MPGEVGALGDHGEVGELVEVWDVARGQETLLERGWPEQSGGTALAETGCHALDVGLVGGAWPQVVEEPSVVEEEATEALPEVVGHASMVVAGALVGLDRERERERERVIFT